MLFIQTGDCDCIFSKLHHTPQAMRSGEIKLSPEQRKAIEVFETAINYQESLTVPKISEEHVSVTGSRIFVVGKIGRKSLPHEHHWVWNQSKAQQTIENSNTHEIVMYKLNPRKKNKSQIQGYPSYKLWVFVMKSKFGEAKYNTNFIWCERGKQDELNETKRIEVVIENKPSPSVAKIELYDDFWKDIIIKGEFIEYEYPLTDLNVFAM